MGSELSLLMEPEMGMGLTLGAEMGMGLTLGADPWAENEALGGGGHWAMAGNRASG